MKKYIKPNTEVIDVKLQQMMAGSLPLDGTTTIDNPSDILSPEMDDDFEFDF